MEPLYQHMPVQGAKADIVMESEEFVLNDYGIDVKILHTPGGTSPGLISLLLDMGDPFVADLAMNMFPLRLTPGLPIYADDLSQAKKLATPLGQRRQSRLSGPLKAVQRRSDASVSITVTPHSPQAAGIS